MSDRPVVAAYDIATAVGVTRPMTDDEYAQWQTDEATATTRAAIAAEPKPPPAADAVLGALASLDPATASVADVVNAVKGALQQAGATPV